MSDAPLSIACIGECMGELAGQDDTLKLSFAGDSFNTATYLSRLLSPQGHNVSFVTVIGEDSLSQKMRNRFEVEALNTDCVFTTPDRTVGLYLIDNDDKGERSFTYWRDQSAARTLMDHDREAMLHTRLSTFDLIYLSGISLAILPDDARGRLIQILKDLAVPVAFDPNYRPSLWTKLGESQEACRQIAPVCHYVLSSLEDERAIWSCETAEAAAHAWHDRGAQEVVVKNGGETTLVARDDIKEVIAPERVARPLDTTGAGDAFNAAYLAARLTGQSSKDACCAAHTLSAKVIMHRGAIM